MKDTIESEMKCLIDVFTKDCAMSWSVKPILYQDSKIRLFKKHYYCIMSFWSILSTKEAIKHILPSHCTEISPYNVKSKRWDT